MQSPSAVSLPDFFPEQKAATPPPVAQQNNARLENFYPYEDEILEEVTHTDPSPPTRMYTPHRSRTTSSSSSAYDTQDINRSDPSPSHQLTYADVVHRPRYRLSSSSSTRSSLPPDSVASQTRSHTGSLTLERPKIYMPLITFDPLPVLKEGEGLEESDNVAINIVDENKSWTVVR